ncbi:MAG TPA: hypothetical protein PKC25_14440 [Candidatus Rifleibacterium sp.]|nr:hypothetical protein [Candidatus Rifleibacterium sp.]
MSAARVFADSWSLRADGGTYEDIDNWRNQVCRRHLVEELIDRRHDLTMLNRGNNNIFPQLKTITGDRNEPRRIDLAAGQQWDAVIDTCAYFPRQVRMLAGVLRSAAHYVMISSISAYQNQETANLCENDALAVISEDTPEQITGETYGGFI